MKKILPFLAVLLVACVLSGTCLSESPAPAEISSNIEGGEASAPAESFFNPEEGESSAPAESFFRIADGMAQPILRYTDARQPDYTNEGSDLLRFTVYVETDYDTDLDGRPDLIKAVVQMPRAAAEGRCRVPVIYEARPYIAGMYTYNPVLPAVGASVFDASALRAQPEKRAAAGEISVLDLAAEANPADWNYQLDSDPFLQQYLGNFTAYDYYLVRGFALVQAAGPGTWGSEGIECCADDLEADAFRCVIEWLTGDRNAFSDRESCLRVPADWCSGKIAMTGRSYAGAMAFEVASSGVRGLETVVPVAGVSSWYDYNNAQGAPSGVLGTYDALADLSALCASRFPDGADEALESMYRDYLASLRDQQIALAGDYGAFWAERDYSSRSGFRASALIVQGLNDETVRPKQFDLMRSAFLASGCQVRCILHQNGHVTPANEQTQTDIMIGDHSFTEWLNLWFTHELLGVENEVSSMPDFLVQSNLDGTFYAADQWNTENVLTLQSADPQERTVSARDAHLNNAVLLSETCDGASGSDHALWSAEVAQDLTVNGPAAVHLRVRVSNPGEGVPMIGALLVDQADEPFPCFDTRSIGVLDQRVIAEDGVDRGEGTEPYDLVEWVQTEANRKLIAYGTMDLRNPHTGYLPSSAAAESEPFLPDAWYDCVLYLQPAFYTVQAGHHLELYIVPFCGFSDDSALYDTASREEILAMGIDPDTLVPFTRNYSFTLDESASAASIPIL